MMARRLGDTVHYLLSGVCYDATIFKTYGDSLVLDLLVFKAPVRTEQNFVGYAGPSETPECLLGSWHGPEECGREAQRA
jgi:hypothetical protein